MSSRVVSPYRVTQIIHSSHSKNFKDPGDQALNSMALKVHKTKNIYIHKFSCCQRSPESTISAAVQKTQRLKKQAPHLKEYNLVTSKTSIKAPYDEMFIDPLIHNGTI